MMIRMVQIANPDKKMRKPVRSAAKNPDLTGRTAITDTTIPNQPSQTGNRLVFRIATDQSNTARQEAPI